MAAPPPTAFSASLEKWIASQTQHSIFYVSIVPREEDAIHKDIKDRMRVANHVHPAKRPGYLKKGGYSSTGFVIEEGPLLIKILTCAHVLEHVYTAQYALSPQEANRLFETYVYCDHAEETFRQQGQLDAARVYTEARIINVNCDNDFMILHVRRQDMGGVCMAPHPPLRFSLAPPVPFDECAMVSWPPRRHRTSVKGRVSHASRSFADLCRPNPTGYRMDFMEVDIAGEHGSSGAPLMDGNAKVIGMLHGSAGGRFCFFLRMADIIDYLTQQDVPILQG